MQGEPAFKYALVRGLKTTVDFKQKGPLAPAGEKPVEQWGMANPQPPNLNQPEP